MGLLAEDLKRWKKVASPEPPSVSDGDPLGKLRGELERYAGAETSLEKEASEADYERLYTLHKNVESAYRGAVKAGKKPEADKALDKFSSWRYLKGAPGEPGDLTPLPEPEEK